MTEQRTFPVLATVTLGRLKRGYLYLEALRHMDVLFSTTAERLLPIVSCAETRRDVDVVAVTPADLGIDVADRIDRFLGVAKEHGLELSPAEVAPALLIIWIPDMLLRIAMEPIDLNEPLEHRFEISTLWGRKLISCDFHRYVGPDERWAFVQPRSTP